MQADQLKVRCHRPSGHRVGRGVTMWLHSPSRALTLLEMQAVKRKCVRNNEERERERGGAGEEGEREREG